MEFYDRKAEIEILQQKRVNTQLWAIGGTEKERMRLT